VPNGAQTKSLSDEALYSVAFVGLPHLLADGDPDPHSASRVRWAEIAKDRPLVDSKAPTLSSQKEASLAEPHSSRESSVKRGVARGIRGCAV